MEWVESAHITNHGVSRIASDSAGPTLDGLREELRSLLPYLGELDPVTAVSEKIRTLHPEPSSFGSQDADGFRLADLAALYLSRTGEQRLAMKLHLWNYSQILAVQTQDRVHKGHPLVRVADCAYQLRWPWHDHRYLLLTLCEDAVSNQGEVRDDSGCCSRLMRRHGYSKAEVVDLTRTAYQAYQVLSPPINIFPERIVTAIVRHARRVPPISGDSLECIVSTEYVSYLLARLGGERGEELEQLAEYLLSCVPGCQTKRREITKTSDIDVTCEFIGPDLDFRSELGRYVLCECKDLAEGAKANVVKILHTTAKTCGSRAAILFSVRSVSGLGSDENGERAIRDALGDGMVVLLVDGDDLRDIAGGADFLRLLARRHEEVRLDLRARSRPRREEAP